MHVRFEVPTYSSPDHQTTTAKSIHLHGTTLSKTFTSQSPEHSASTVRITLNLLSSVKRTFSHLWRGHRVCALAQARRACLCLRSKTCPMFGSLYLSPTSAKRRLTVLPLIGRQCVPTVCLAVSAAGRNRSRMYRSLCAVVTWGRLLRGRSIACPCCWWRFQMFGYSALVTVATRATWRWEAPADNIPIAWFLWSIFKRGITYSKILGWQNISLLFHFTCKEFLACSSNRTNARAAYA